ncbi:unnamed protein product [Mytilus coruscus]|uniref:Uncharacterized protein n=1 Tax=Mytilus coruscus TaxID=42192 RepID=A0A6J8EN58_MYTCO|nr:unnamed protein product [Mytilus coruscus]
MASTVHVVLLSLLFITIASPKCTFTTVTARCECDSYLEVYEKVLLIEIESERCNCTIKLMNSKSIPEVTNVFNRECQWVCTNDTCRLWIWVALSSLITMVVIIKLFMQLRWHNRQYLPLHRTFNTTTESQPISNVQSSYLTISSSHPSDAVIHNILPVTPPPSSTPEKSDTTLLPPLFFNDRDPSPEPSAPPMEIELELQSPASSPVATRTRSQSKRKIMFQEAKL